LQIPVENREDFMAKSKITAGTVREIAHEAFQNAHEILQLIEVMQLQNRGRINVHLSEAGAARAGIVVRNSLIARITLLVSGCYAPTRDGDKHLRRAFEIMRDPAIRAEIEKDGSKRVLDEAEQLWNAINQDPQLKTVKHFRDKYTAHSAEPKANVPIPNYDEFFDFARATAHVMEKLAHAAGGTTDTLDDLMDTMIASAQEFWKPWETAQG
jgi:hypothetical protein